VCVTIVDSTSKEESHQIDGCHAIQPKAKALLTGAVWSIF
jgi:hypothetical protein